VLDFCAGLFGKTYGVSILEVVISPFLLSFLFRIRGRPLYVQINEIRPVMDGVVQVITQPADITSTQDPVVIVWNRISAIATLIRTLFEQFRQDEQAFPYSDILHILKRHPLKLVPTRV